MSVEAISWALNLAPVPRDRGGQPSSACKFVFVGFPDHAGPDGTGPFPSVATLVPLHRIVGAQGADMPGPAGSRGDNRAVRPGYCRGANYARTGGRRAGTSARRARTSCSHAGDQGLSSPGSADRRLQRVHHDYGPGVPAHPRPCVWISVAAGVRSVKRAASTVPGSRKYTKARSRRAITGDRRCRDHLHAATPIPDPHPRFCLDERSPARQAMRSSRSVSRCRHWRADDLSPRGPRRRAGKRPGGDGGAGNACEASQGTAAGVRRAACGVIAE